jgi:hypothetical protein
VLFLPTPALKSLNSKKEKKMEEPPQAEEAETQNEETQNEEPQSEEPQSQYEETQFEEEQAPAPKKRGRPRMTPEQKKEAKAARNRLKVVETKPPAVKKEPAKPKIIERVVREYVEVPVPAVQQSPFESIGNVLRNQALSSYERKKQQWASFQLI